MTCERDVRIDFARATAVIMMILQHVCIYLHNTKVIITPFSAAIIELILLVTKSAVPLFVMITGSVLLSDNKDFTYSKGIILAKKMIGIIIAWNIINAVYYYCFDGIKVAASKMIYGNYWYLYMLVGLYLLMPIINPILKNYKTTKIPQYVVLLTILYSLWLSFSLLLPELVLNYASRFVDKFMLSVVTGFTGYLFLGYLIRNDAICLSGFNRVKKIYLVLASSIPAILLYIYSIFTALKNNLYNYVYFDEFTAILIAAFIFSAFMKCQVVTDYKKIGGGGGYNSFKKIMLFIGTHSLGIYVISNVFLDILIRANVNVEMFPNLLVGLVTCWILIIAPSCAVVFLMSKSIFKKIV